MPSLTVAVIADTHRSAARAADLPPEVFALVADAGVVLHAGDITDAEVLEVLDARSPAQTPVHAVLGNNDLGLEGVLPDRLVLDLGGVTVAMVHDSGPATGRPRRLHRWFPDADVVVFGHSHIPWNSRGVDGQLLLNPGSPTQRRRQPVASVGRLVITDASVTEVAIIPISPAG